jgi:CheY-like chemotaxis protein
MNTASDEVSKNDARKRAQRQTILVLEDDPNVRSFTVTALQGQGYRVLEADDVTAAMSVLSEERGSVDLLLSDIALPSGGGGPEFAARAKELIPELKLVFMSGYVAELYSGEKVPGFDETLLVKPFTLADLAKAVHEALGA